MDWTAVGTIVAVILSLMIFSYLIGDNVLFRLAEHILVGVSVGYATVTIIFNVFIPAVNNLKDASSNMATGNNSLILALYLIPLLAGVFFLFRPLRAARPLTNMIIALVIGTVSALSLGGALAGTLIPQAGATMLPLTQNNNGGGSADLFTIIGNVVLVVCTVTTLWYFQFTIRKNQGSGASGSRVATIGQRSRLLGRWTLMLALGAVFASVFLTYLAALIDRLSFLLPVR